MALLPGNVLGTSKHHLELPSLLMSQDGCKEMNNNIRSSAYSASVNTFKSKQKLRNHKTCPPRVWGIRGERAFISGEQENKGQILRGTKTILGNREHKKTNFFF